MRTTRSIAVAGVLALSFNVWSSVHCRGERVGYSFEGAFIQPVWSGTGTPPTEYNVFGVRFPFDAPLTGTFSYDTTAAGVIPFPGAKDFKQFIQGGFTFNVFSSVGGPPVLQLVANVYPIRVVNDYTPSGAPVASDLLSVEFNTLSDPSLPRIIKNGSTYTKATIITAPLSWDWSTFNDPDEPKLRSELPHDNLFPFQGSITAQGAATFVIRSFSRISQCDGDYNIDGLVDGNDYPSWRKAFGESSVVFSYADGNHDGIVDGADYVIWRSRKDVSITGAFASQVPEPSTILLAGASLLLVAGYKRRRFIWA
jgi:hypothetical protein